MGFARIISDFGPEGLHAKWAGGAAQTVKTRRLSTGEEIMRCPLWIVSRLAVAGRSNSLSGSGDAPHSLLVTAITGNSAILGDLYL